tara:strand:+ start:176 stop:835 length:660 start_codon:yes stop_codon:yes gene_type:complete
MKALIELDEYLDLTDLDDVNEEFLNSIDKVPFRCMSDFEYGKDPAIYPLDHSDNIPVKGILYFLLRHRNFSRNHHRPNGYSLDDDYYLTDKHKHWEDSVIYKHFPKLKKLISKMPFKGVGRMIAVFSRSSVKSVIHRDHDENNWRQEFIWLRLNKKKKVFLLENHEPIYIKGSSGWFDSFKYHGTESQDDIAVSVRIDGEFTQEFREKLFGKNSKWKTI